MKEKAIFFLASVLLSLSLTAQKVIVNPDGTHPVVIDNGNTQTVVHPNGTHSTLIENGSTKSIVNPNGTHTPVIDHGNIKTIQPGGRSPLLSITILPKPLFKPMALIHSS